MIKWMSFTVILLMASSLFFDRLAIAGFQEIESDRDIHAYAEIYDCGTLALYHFLKLDGYAVDLSHLAAALPPPAPRGFSMKELRDAAAVYGCSLNGCRIEKSADFEFLSLLFLNRRPHGHFVVVRPVGHTGNLVQIFDGIQPPIVMDKKKLIDSREWTGYALVKISNTKFILLLILGFVCMVFTALYLYFRKLRTVLSGQAASSRGLRGSMNVRT
jgi:hypothetical protein